MTPLFAFLLLNSVSQQDPLGKFDLKDAERIMRSVIDRNHRLDAFDEGYGEVAIAKPEVFKVGAGSALIQLNFCIGAFDTFTGETANITMEGDFEAKRKILLSEGISTEVAEASLREILDLAGFKHPVKIMECKRQSASRYRIFAIPDVGKRDLSPAFIIQCELYAQRGQLDRIWLPRVPKTDHAEDAVLGEDELTDKAWAAYQAAEPYEKGYIAEKRLVLEVPKYGTPHNLTADYAPLVKDWQVIPVWRVLIFKEEDRGKAGVWDMQIVHVDARNGRVLKVDR